MSLVIKERSFGLCPGIGIRAKLLEQNKFKFEPRGEVSGSEADPSLYPRAEKTMTFTHHRPWKSLKIDPRKDVGLAGFCGRAAYPGKSGGRDFRKRKGTAMQDPILHGVTFSSSAELTGWSRTIMKNEFNHRKING
ncbi:unnamed protein product [Rangifer tarandus platyrhynchus]|uniref:Uncharacterized protein n=2 Tax=Rangifer tarandus platyrhynchus TaxID=3082113 RepID=A0AC59Z529_RANTA|nr:unnamed protein product [Rangifer tarandus platyrhynchus]